MMIYQGSTLKATVTSTSYAVTGLTASTAYTFSVKAKDAAGNVSLPM
jgi:chitodextrinase